MTGRQSWPVRRYRLGEEPGDDLSRTTSVADLGAGVMQDVDGLSVPFLGRTALVRNKRASGRAKDLADLEALGERL